MALGEPLGFGGGDPQQVLNPLGIFNLIELRQQDYETAQDVLVGVIGFTTNNDTQPTFTDEFTFSGSYRIPDWDFTFNVVGNDTIASINKQPETSFTFYLFQDPTTGVPGRRILQSDLDKYETAFTFADTFDLPDGIVSTIDDLSEVGETDEVRISTISSQIGTQFNDDPNY
jgi:hypothetical protein